MRIPSAEGNGGKADPRFDQPGRQQAALSKLVLAKRLRDLWLFTADIECRAGLGRTDHRQRLLVKAIEAIDHGVLTSKLLKRGIDFIEQLLSRLELVDGQAVFERDTT